MTKHSPGPLTEYQKGVILGASAYLTWGFLPIYLYLTRPAPPIEVVAVRIFWALLVCLVFLAIMRQLKPAWKAAMDRTLMSTILLSSIMIGLNWLIYTYAASINNLLEGALGYFINPIISVLLGVIFLKERLRWLQWAAVLLCAIAVAVMTFSYGQVPWIALALALSFGLYSLLKNKVNRKVTALVSLSLETAVLLPVAFVIVAVLVSQGEATAFSLGAGHFWILALGGLVTVVPLLLFGGAAGRLPLSIVGLLQFISPIVIFLIAILVFSEPMPVERWTGFFLVWGSLILFVGDSLYQQRKQHRLARAALRQG